MTPRQTSNGDHIKELSRSFHLRSIIYLTRIYYLSVRFRGQLGHNSRKFEYNRSGLKTCLY